MKGNIKKLFAFLAVCIVIVSAASLQPATAYFNRGAVGISAGMSSVSLEAGQSISVSVDLSPASEDQLPGCGMAECPQICGEKDCLDENGECTCNGTIPNTYRTSVSCASSNTAVASASYSSGAVTITANAAGEAVITLTASLRQHTDTSTSISVSVTGSTAPDDKPVTPSPSPSPDGKEDVPENEDVLKPNAEPEPVKESAPAADDEESDSNSSITVILPGESDDTGESKELYTLRETKMEGTMMFVDLD
ncbi:MAG: hypothetical protein HUJ65_00915, partial [Oscillospiraceae bacterium]|nr:hypothetical protein [Oscillospiraceae bacterium]